MKYYYRENDWWHIGFDYSPRLVTEVKKFNGAGYNPENKEWYVPAFIATDPAVVQWLKENGFTEGMMYTPSPWVLSYVEPESVLSAQDVLEGCKALGLKRTPRHYQAEGIAYMLNHGNCINGDACGLGKTGQSICVCELLNCFPVLVICPASVKYNWKKEWARWNPDRTVGVVDPRLSKRKRESLPNPWECDVTVINFDLLSGGRTERGDLKPRFKELMKRMWQGCVIDEIHFLKNERAIRSRMAKRICKTIPNVWGLTGTLTQNRPADLIGPYTVLRRFTEMFNNSLAFKFRYCDAKKTVFGFDWSGASNLEELHELLRMGGYIRRDKRDVLKELPPLVSEYVDVPLSNASEYGEAEENLIKYLNESGQEERVDSALNAEFLVQLNILRQLCIEGKLDFIRKYVKDWLDANENDSLVIFGVHKEPLALLAEEFKCPVIQGGVTPVKRQEIVEGFIARKYRVLVCNIQAAGTGMDGLQQASSNMFFVEYPDRYTDIEQTVARLERMGQTMPVTVTYLMASGTVDEDYRDMLNDKRSITQTVNDGRSELEFLKRKFRMGKGFKREVR